MDIKISKYCMNSLSLQYFGDLSIKAEAAVKMFHHKMDLGTHRFVEQEEKKTKNKNTSLRFFKVFLINAIMQSQFVAIYKYGNTLTWGPGGGPKPNNHCINS